MSPEKRDLAQVVTDWHGDAAVLRRHGQTAMADQLERCAADVRDAAEEWMTWLSETDAMLRTQRSREWMRAHFAAWEREGHARLAGRIRQYRAAVMPRRYSLSGARQAGAEAAKALRGRGLAA